MRRLIFQSQWWCGLVVDKTFCAYKLRDSAVFTLILLCTSTGCDLCVSSAMEKLEYLWTQTGELLVQLFNPYS